MEFNLVTQPWVKVMEPDKTVKAVSLFDVFKNASQYTDLAGDVKAQDVAVMRFLLAILSTVYMRVDAQGKGYPNFNSLSDDEKNKVLLRTWVDLKKQGNFSDVVETYLKTYKSRFDMFSKRFPFGQATEDQFKSVIAKPIGNGNLGKVNYKQMNRMINESNNSVSTWAFANFFDKMHFEMSDFARWLITYQAYTGSTDKLKLKGVKAATFAGGCLVITPTFAKGDNLFETLMLNLKLHVDKYTKSFQRPIWETSFNNLIKARKAGSLPDNLAELYTMPSRLVYINWEDTTPDIYVAGLPKVNYDNGFIEPMTTWHKTDDTYHPDVKRSDDLSRSMWENYGNFISLDHNTHGLGIASWLQYLCDNKAINSKYQFHLASAGFIKSANAMAQTPELSYNDDFKIDAGVLLSNEGDNHWSHDIIHVIDKTQKIAKSYYGLAMNICELSGASEDTAKRIVARQMIDFYDAINVPFKDWLGEIDPKDDPKEQDNKWQKILNDLLEDIISNFKENANGRAIAGSIVVDDSGKVRKNNLFTQISLFWYKVHKIEKEDEGAK